MKTVDEVGNANGPNVWTSSGRWSTRLFRAHLIPSWIAARVTKGCCHGNLALAERKSEGLGSSSGRRRCLPILERFVSEGAERVAGNKMALNVETSYGRRREWIGTVAPSRAI
jgi:hypothetical protein